MSYYSKQWSSATPGYLIFLVDQSGSMGEIYTGDETNAGFTAKAINRVIQNLVITNTAGEKTKDRVFISLIGYGGKGGNSIDDIRSDYLSKFADQPLRIEKVTKKVSDGAGGLIDIQDELPIFLEPLSPKDGLTPMASAIEFVQQLIQGWIQKKPDNPAPVIINITDGMPYNGNQLKPEEERDNTIKAANDLLNVSTNDGPPLLFSVHISATGNEITFPEGESELKGNEMAELLFKISSKVPDAYKVAASKLQLNVKQNSKGFIANADPVTLIKFINFGSSGGMQDIK